MGIEDAIDGRLEGLGLGEAAHGQVLMLDVAPQMFNDVQFWGVRGQVEDGDAGGLEGGEEILDDGAAMDGVVVQQDDAGPRAPVGRRQLLGRGGEAEADEPAQAAVKLLLGVVSLRPDWARGQFSLGCAYEHLGDRERARAAAHVVRIENGMDRRMF